MVMEGPQDVSLDTRSLSGLLGSGPSNYQFRKGSRVHHRYWFITDQELPAYKVSSAPLKLGH